MVPVWRLNAPGTWALPLAPFAAVADWKVPSELEQLLVEHTSNVTLPSSAGSGSLNVALRVGVVELTKTPSAGASRGGVVGARSAVLFVTARPAAVRAGLPVGVTVSRIMGSLPGCAYARVSASA